MKARSARYLIGEGLKNIWLNRMMSIASIGVLMASMLLMGIAIAFSENVDRIMSEVESQNVVMVFLDDELSDEQVQSVYEQIKSLDNINPDETTYIPSSQALEGMLNEMGPQYEEYFNQYFEEGNTIMPETVRASMIDLEKFDQTITAIENVEGVQSYNSSRDLAVILTTARDAINTAGVWIIVLLSLIALVIISNTVRITMFNRKLEISIMKAVGATNGFIRFPFMIEGITLGVIASLLTVGVEYLLYKLALKALNPIMKIFTYNPVPFSDFMWIILLIFLALGIISGLIASIITISKYLRREGSEFSAL